MGDEHQLSLPFDLEDCGGIDAVYVDQAPYQTRYRGYCFAAIYTPFGIKRRDSEYAERIIAGSDLESLRWEIMGDEHLHPAIKQNLIANLDNRS